MRGMQALLAGLLMALAAVPVAAESRSLTEDDFRRMLKLAPSVAVRYRSLDCRALDFAKFAEAMKESGVGSEIERAADGSSVTATIHRRGTPSCPSPYPPVTQMPPFDLRDLEGRRVTSSALKGKPTLVNFYFAKCVPCILEVGPLNRYAASRPDMNFLAVTFDEPDEAREFIRRFGFEWRVVPDARDFIDRMRVKNYPLMALFDAQGRLLGTKRGGARDEVAAAAVFPQLKRWVESLERGASP
jgi:cytochrome oxidase Cu insertion factor (SCO1/SenC/PrrC family)